MKELKLLCTNHTWLIQKLILNFWLGQRNNSYDQTPAHLCVCPPHPPLSAPISRFVTLRTCVTPICIPGSDRFYLNIEDMIGYKPIFFIKWCWMILTPGICAVSRKQCKVLLSCYYKICFIIPIFYTYYSSNDISSCGVFSAGDLLVLPHQIQTAQVQQCVHLPWLGLRYWLVHGLVLNDLHPAGDDLEDLEDPWNLLWGSDTH